MSKIIVYSKDQCGYCVKAKALLNSKSIEFKEININEKAEAFEYIVSQGHRSMPQIYIDDKSIGGYTELLKYIDSL